MNNNEYRDKLRSAGSENEVFKRSTRTKKSPVRSHRNSSSSLDSVEKEVIEKEVIEKKIIEKEVIGKPVVEIEVGTSIEVENIINFEIPESKKKTVKMDLDTKIKINNLVESLPTFSGKRDSSLEESLNVFLKKCTNKLDILNNAEQQYFMTLIDGQFRGDALILANAQNFKTFDNMQEFLYAYYVPRRDPSDVVREINNIFQKPNESILEYRERLEALVGLAKSLIDQQNLAKEITEYNKKDIVKQAIKAFKIGIRDRAIQTALFHEKCDTIEDIADAAVRWEKLEKLRDNHYSSRWGTEDTSNIGLIEKIMESKIKSLIDEKYANKPETILEKLAGVMISSETKQPEKSPMQENENKSNFERKFCQFCQRKGHSISECRTRRNAPFCKFCHQYYHTIESCPRRTERTQNFNPTPPTKQYPDRRNYNNQQNFRNERQFVNYNNQTHILPVQQQNQPRNGFQNKIKQSTDSPNKQFTSWKPGPQQGVRMIQQHEYYRNSEPHDQQNYSEQNFSQSNVQYDISFDECRKEQYQQGNDSRGVCSQQAQNPL